MTRRIERTGSRTKRRVRHAVVISLLGVVLALVVLGSFGGTGPGTQRASLVTGYASLLAIIATLLLGPLRVLRRQPNPVTSDLRRDVGIAAAVTGVAHLGFAIQHHFGGSLRSYFFVDGRVALGSVRTDAFGWAIWIGVVATIILVVLGALSNDASLRKVGRNRWKLIQRSNYALLPLAALHTALFWYVLERGTTTVALLLATLVLVVIAQGVGAMLVRARAFRNL